MQDNLLDDDLKTPLIQQYGINKYHGLIQFVFLLFVASCCALIGILLSGLVIAAFYGNNVLSIFGIFESGLDLNGLRYAQMVTTLSFFLLPAIIFSKYKSKNPFAHIGLDKMFPVYIVFIIPFLIYFFYPFINMTFHINKILPWNDWRIEKQEEYKLMIEHILNNKTYFVLILNLIMIAILPAISEECLFRGVIQKFFSEYMNIHVAVFLSAIIFSLVHDDFSAFLPRIILGMFLGYLFYYSGSLWTSIFAHALNNGAQVVLMYLNNKGIYKIDVDNPEMPKTWEILVYTAIFAALWYLFYHFAQKNKNTNFA